MGVEKLNYTDIYTRNAPEPQLRFTQLTVFYFIRQLAACESQAIPIFFRKRIENIGSQTKLSSMVKGGWAREGLRHVKKTKSYAGIIHCGHATTEMPKEANYISLGNRKLLYKLHKVDARFAQFDSFSYLHKVGCNMSSFPKAMVWSLKPHQQGKGYYVLHIRHLETLVVTFLYNM